MGRASVSKVSHDRHFTTSDGVALHYLDFGHGRTIVMVPGWSQSAAMFREQLLPLSKHFRCIAIDMRGHGESDNSGKGFTIKRLAADLEEFVAHLSLDKPILLGHSMGASVLWSYAEQFGTKNVSKFVFIDQAPVLSKDPAWSPEECERYGAIFDQDSLEEVCRNLSEPSSSVEVTKELLRGMFTTDFSEQQLDWVLTENLKFDRTSAANLLRDHCQQDWRVVIRNITIPSLVVGGRSSMMPWQSQVWLSDNLPNAKLNIFEAEEGGQHFMFLENPAVFNKVICNFCQ